MEAKNNVAAMILGCIQKNGSRMFFQNKEGWSWKQVTWLDFKKELKSVASFLHTLGFAKGDRAVISYPHTYKAQLAECATYLLGGICVPVSAGSSAEEIGAAAQQSAAKLVFCHTGDIAEALNNSSDNPSGNGSVIDKIVTYENVPIGKDSSVLPFSALLAFGSMKAKSLDENVLEFAANLKPEGDALMLSSLNGRIASPRMIRNAQIAESIERAASMLAYIGDNDHVFSYLPEASGFSGLISYTAMNLGIRASLAESEMGFLENVVELKPTVVFYSGSAIEKLYAALTNGSYAEGIKKALGGRVKTLVSDQAPSGEIVRGFEAAGIRTVVIEALSLEQSEQ